MAGTLLTKETVRPTHSLMMEHNGKTVIAMVMEIIHYPLPKVMNVPTHTEPVSKIDSDALTGMEMGIQMRETHSQVIVLNGQTQILTDTVIITTMTSNNLRNSTSIKEETRSR